MAMSLINFFKSSLDGGTSKYSTTSGSRPELRINAKVLREVSQSGL
jgi:hypothetical protein